VKFTIHLASLLLAVKHSLLYWISKPRKTSNFSKLKLTPKFNDNQRITDTDICIFMCMFVHICVYSFHMCYIRFTNLLEKKDFDFGLDHPVRGGYG
jgi:hypothetical protein